MEKKNLIVSGCSFTKGHYLPDTETWGAYTAKKMGLDVHNRAGGGMGNEWISQSIITYFLNNKELLKNSIVMIGWSEPGRLLGTFEKGNGYIEQATIRPDDFFIGDIGEHNRHHWSDDINNYHGYVKKNHKFFIPFFSSFAYCLYQSYYSIYILKQFLESNNIPYLFFDAINKVKVESIDILPELQPFYSIKYIDQAQNVSEIKEMVPNWAIDGMLNDKVASQIFNIPNYISFNGMSMLTYIFDYDYDILTDGNQGHPNSIASDLFSDMIKDKYEKLYN